MPQNTRKSRDVFECPQVARQTTSPLSLMADTLNRTLGNTSWSSIIAKREQSSSAMETKIRDFIENSGGNDENRDELYKDRFSRKIDYQRLFSGEYDFPKTFSLTENQFSRKTHFYTIASRPGSSTSTHYRSRGKSVGSSDGAAITNGISEQSAHSGTYVVRYGVFEACLS